MLFNKLMKSASVIYGKRAISSTEEVELRMSSAIFAAKIPQTVMRRSSVIFVGHVVGLGPMKKKENFHGMIMKFVKSRNLNRKIKFNISPCFKITRQSL